ncbi:MAG: hypothetical protein V7638_886 [Acidobacteriota bacterium]|jgi:hypothetical protein
MKLKLIAIFAFAVAVIAVGVIRTTSTIQRKNVPNKDRLKWYAKEAKNEGRQKVTMAAPLVEYLGGAGTITADDAFAASTVVIAHLVSKQSNALNDDITTWNRFAIDEVLLEAKELPCPTCLPPEPPPTLLPIKPGEFLIPKTGGTVNIDGVDIEQIDEAFPEYQFDQRYLLLLNLYATGTARTVGGPVGVFKIVENDRIVPVHESEHRIQKDFKLKFGNSLEHLRKHLKVR